MLWLLIGSPSKRNFQYLGSLYSQVKINKKNQHKIAIFFLPIIFSICFGCSKELSLIETVLLSTQHMCWWRKKKNNLQLGHDLPI